MRPRRARRDGRRLRPVEPAADGRPADQALVGEQAEAERHGQGQEELRRRGPGQRVQPDLHEADDREVRQVDPVRAGRHVAHRRRGLAEPQEQPDRAEEREPAEQRRRAGRQPGGGAGQGRDEVLAEQQPPARRTPPAPAAGTSGRASPASAGRRGPRRARSRRRRTSRGAATGSGSARTGSARP